MRCIGEMMDCSKHSIKLTPRGAEVFRLSLDGFSTTRIARNTSDCPNQKLLAPKDVEREFGIRQKTLAYWRQECIGPAYTSFGRRVFYERSVLEEYIASGRIQTLDTLS